MSFGRHMPSSHTRTGTRLVSLALRVARWRQLVGLVALSLQGLISGCATPPGPAAYPHVGETEPRGRRPATMSSRYASHSALERDSSIAAEPRATTPGGYSRPEGVALRTTTPSVTELERFSADNLSWSRPRNRLDDEPERAIFEPLPAPVEVIAAEFSSSAVRRPLAPPPRASVITQTAYVDDPDDLQRRPPADEGRPPLPRFEVGPSPAPDSRILIPPLPNGDTVKPIPFGSGRVEIPLPNGSLGNGRVEIPLQPATPSSSGTVSSTGPLVTISVRDAPLHSVLTLIAQQQGLSIVAGSDLKIPVTVTLQPTTLDNALDAVLAISGCTWVKRNNVIYVTPLKKDGGENYLIQGREVQVFTLNYLASSDVEKVVTGIVSPVGKVFVRQVDSKDRRRTQEQVVVEDLPPYLQRVAQYISQADQPPRQVMVEARLLQVKLENTNRHGVNFDALADLAGADIRFKTQTFAAATGPGMVFTVDGTDFDSLIDCLTTTTDSKTLAAPRVLMINGQESKIQIGRKLGYFVTTTTTTSTLQSVQFLDVGVVLSVTPQITDDDQILMKVRPKVSNGEINPATTLPQEETTEVDTSVMVPDGHGIIIGGLIQELDNDRQSKLPGLGDLWLAGKLFQRRTLERTRVEVIVALLPRIVPAGPIHTPKEAVEWQRTDAPLLTPDLQSAPRPWEPKLKDATRR